MNEHQRSRGPGCSWRCVTVALMAACYALQSCSSNGGMSRSHDDVTLRWPEVVRVGEATVAIAWIRSPSGPGRSYSRMSVRPSPLGAGRDGWSAFRNGCEVLRYDHGLYTPAVRIVDSAARGAVSEHAQIIDSGFSARGREYTILQEATRGAITVVCDAAAYCRDDAGFGERGDSSGGIVQVSRAELEDGKAVFRVVTMCAKHQRCIAFLCVPAIEGVSDRMVQQMYWCGIVGAAREGLFHVSEDGGHVIRECPVGPHPVEVALGPPHK